MSFDSFKAEWESKRVGDPTLTQVGVQESQIYQCVSLVKQYLGEGYGIHAAYWGNAIDYWHSTNPALLTKFDRVTTQNVHKGDIVILNGVNGNMAGHIGIGTGNSNNSQFELLEQNGQTGGGTGLNGDAVRTRYIAKSRIAGVLRPKPPGLPADIRPAVVHPYTIQLIDPKKVIITKPTHKWGMNYDNLTAMLNHPEGTALAGDTKTVAAVCHHAIGYSYYLEDAKVPSGYNVADCKDYRVAVSPPAAHPIPAAPRTAPSSEQYVVVKAVPGYLTSGLAATRQRSNSTVTAGTYNVFNRFNGMVNVTRKPGYAGWWINPADNVLKPAAHVAVAAATIPSVAVLATAPLKAPEAPTLPNWRSTYRSFVNKDGVYTPVKYVALTNYTVKDLETRLADVPLQAGMVVWIGGTFAYEGKVIGRPQDAVTHFTWYGIPLDENIIEPYDSVYSIKKSLSDRQATRTLKSHDYLVIAAEKAAKFIDIITGKNKK